MSETTNNQSAERSPTHAQPKASGGVFSWLTGGRSPAHATTTTARSNASGSPPASGNVSPARTASPSRSSASASSSRSPSRSPQRSPARRVVIPALAMGMSGGGRGPAVMMDIGPRTVYVQSDDEDETAVESTITSAATQEGEMKLPPSVQIHTKTIGDEQAENQAPEPTLKVRKAAFFPSEDNQTEETNEQVTTHPTTTVRYVTTKSENGDNHRTPIASPSQHITTTMSNAVNFHALPPLASPSGPGGIQSVRYIAKSTASPAHATSSASPGRVRYISKTMAVDGGLSLPSPATPSPAGSTNVRFFGSPMQKTNVHYVTRVVNGQSVQVPVPVGAPSHDHRVHYVRTPSPAAGGVVAATTTTTTTTTVSPSSSVSSTKSSTEHQHVRYIAKSAIPTPVPALPNQVQYVTTRPVAEGESQSATVSVPLSAVVASTVAGQNGSITGLSPAHHIPASLLRLDSTFEGLPSRHFRGIALTDTDSSDGEDAEVKMVFDIMLQKFVPVPTKPKRRSPRAAAAAAATATATASAAVAGAAVAAKEEAELEEKAPVPTVEEEEKAKDNALATTEEQENAKDNGLAVGLVAAAAVGAAAAAGVAVAAAKPSPMMKLDTVAAPANPTVAESPSGLKKRTPSQTKREPSPRVPVPIDDIALDMDASPAQYAELRSPTSNHGDHDGMPAGSRLGHIGMSLKVRVWRWLLITLLSLAVIVFLMILFYKGVSLRKIQKSEYSYAKQNDMLDNYNGYVGVVASLFTKPIELLIAVVVPILFFSFVAKALLGRKLSPRLLTMMFAFSSILGFLLSNGFHGINVQMRTIGVAPVIALNDLSLTLSAAAALSALVASNASSNASNIVTEGGVGNAITNTVLRGVVVPPVDDATTADASAPSSNARRLQTTSTSSATPLLCTNTFDARNVLGTSDLGALTTLSTTTVATYGFPMRAWQEQMLSSALPDTNVAISLDSTTPLGVASLSSVSGLPMRVRTAANLFLQSVHVARDVFGWFGDDSSPLSVEKVVNAQYSKNDGKNPTYVPLVDLMNLTVPGSLAEETLAAPAFVSQVRSLFNQSLAGATNISRSESTLEFSSVKLPNGYSFDSVTMDIPLVKSFLSRRLTSAGSAFAEAKAPTNETDVFYDLDIANDCGPYASACEVRRTEYDANGRVYEPPTTIRAFALCNNSLGNDDLEVFFDGAQTKKSVAYTCNGKASTGMLVVSVSSRIVGDALIEGPSPLVPRLVAGMATLKNPRKIYSLTVGKLSWTTTNLALKFHAACSVGPERCTGLDYALTAALENATETLSSLVSGSLRGAVATVLDQEKSKNKEYEYLIVGSDFLPLRLLPTFAYNATETAASSNTTTKRKPVSGFPLVSITKPLQGDSLFQNDGDLAAAVNFKNVSWKSTAPRTGASCSATVEARLNSVLNNHYYMDRGVQPVYTSAMFFLFQDAVTRTQIALAGGTSGLSTLRFASTVEFMELHASIPLLNVVLTLVGCGLILIVSLLVAVRSMRGKQSYSADEDGQDGTHPYAPPESFARVKLDRALFPAIVLKRRVIDLTESRTSTATETTGASSTKNGQSGGGIIGGGDEGERIDAFTVGAVRLEHDHRDVEAEVPFGMGK